MRSALSILIVFIFISFIFMIFCAYVCSPYKRGHLMPWKKSYWQLWATMWLPGIEPGFSNKSAAALNHWAIFPARVLFFIWNFMLNLFLAEVSNYNSVALISLLFLLLKSNFEKYGILGPWSIFLSHLLIFFVSITDVLFLILSLLCLSGSRNLGMN